jgi:branched-chain amino acid transport system permease protein
LSRKQVSQSIQVVVAVILLFLLPLIISEMKIHLLIEIFIFSLFAVSFNLLMGSCGLSPFGHAAFFGVGAYTAALMFNNLPGTPLIIVLVVVAFSGLVTSLIIGFFCIRTSGIYFALLSFAFQMFLFAVALKWRAVTNGDDGMGVIRPALYLPGIGKLSLMNIYNLYYVTLVCVGLGIAACYFFLKTPLGNAVVCMRENSVRASFLGYNAFLTKLIVFSFSGLIAALSGCLFVLFNEFVATSVIDANMSFSVVLMTVIGGTGVFLGPILGVAFYLLFQNWISSLTTYWWFFLGIVFIVVVLYMDGGLVGLFKNKRLPFRLSKEEK